MEVLLAFLWLALNVEIACRMARALAARPSFLQLATALGGCTLLWCLLCGLLSLVGQLRPEPIRWCVGPALLLLAWKPASPGYLSELVQPWSGAFRLSCLLVLVLIALATLAPNTHWDAHTYHYSLPKLYLGHGGLYHTELGSYNGLAGICHLVNTIAMGWGGEMSANGCGLLYLVLLGSGLAALSGEAAPLALLMMLGSPLFIVQSNGGLTDLPSAAYSVLLMGHFLQQRWAWSALWAVVLVLAKLTGILALVSIWPLVWQHSRRLVLFSALIGVISIPPLLWLSPLGDDWAWDSLLNGNADALSCSLVTELPSWNLRRWQEVLSPCILPGLLASLAVAGPHRQLIAALAWASLLSGLLHLHSPRYALSMATWAIVPAAVGWLSLWKSRLRLCQFALALGLGTSLALSAACLFRPLGAALGRPDRESYLRARIAPLEAYRWLETQPYRRPLVLDSRVYLAPITCRVLSAEQIAGWSQQHIASHLLNLNPDVILWSTDSQPTMTGLLGRAFWLNRVEELRPDEWLSKVEPRRLQDLPYKVGAWAYDPRAQILYAATRFEPIVYYRKGILATPCHRENFLRYIRDLRQGKERASRRKKQNAPVPEQRGR